MPLVVLFYTNASITVIALTSALCFLTSVCVLLAFFSVLSVCISFLRVVFSNIKHKFLHLSLKKFNWIIL